MAGSEQRVPTQEQQDHALLVQTDLVEYFNRQIAEGMDWPSLISGVGAATTALIQNSVGARHVSPWFARMAELTRGFGDVVN